jgi:drug/metabolite transporter (DMT)-like permease
MVLAEMHPLALAVLRVGFATPVLLAIAWRRDRVLPARRDLPWLALLGALGVFGNQVLFIWGLSLTTATDAAILMPSIPVFAAGLAVALGLERVGLRRLAGIALAVAGGLVVLDPTRFSLADRAAVGNLLILVNCLFYAGFLVLQRPVLERLPWRTVIAWSFLFGSLGVLAVGGGELAALEPGAVSRGAWLGVAFVLLFPTVLGYLLATWAVRRSSLTLVAAYTTLQPPLSALLAAAFLDERFGVAEEIGFSLIAGGLWLVSRRRRRAAPTGGP